MSALLSKLIIGTSSIFLLVCISVPVYFLCAYLIFRPVVQPFAFLQYQIYGLPISVPLSLLVIFAGLFYFFTKRNWKLNVDMSLPYSLILLVGVAFLPLSIDLHASVAGIIKLLTIWFLFNIASNGLKTEKDIRLLLKGVLISGCLPLLFGFYQFATGRYDLLVDARVDRLSSVFGIGNAYGIYLSLLAGFALLALLTAKSKNQRVIAIVLLSAVLASQVLALNRGTWIALTLSFAIAAFKYRRHINFKWIAVVVFFMTILFSKTIYDRFSELQDRDRYSSRNTLEGRLNYWQEILPLIIDRPAIGYGVGTSDSVVTKYIGKKEAPHNDYLKLSLEMGVFVSFLYILFLVRLYMFFYRRPFQRKLWVYNFAMIVVCGYFIIISSTQNIFYNQINMPLFLIFMTIGIRVNKNPAIVGIKIKAPAKRLPLY